MPVPSRLWRVQLLGDLRAVRLGDGAADGGAEAVTRFSTRKTAALLACLALSPGRPRTRESLIDRFWPDADPEGARNSLSKALSALRRQLEPPGVEAGAVIVATRGDVAIAAAAVETDVAQLEAALAARGPARPEALARAVALYEGDLAPELDDDWAIAERTRLRAAFQRAAHELVRERLARGDAKGAEAIARRAVQADPLREEAVRDLMEALQALGEAGLARRAFDELGERLRVELGVGPSAATIALDRAIRERAQPLPSPAPPPAADARPASQVPEGLARLVGRDADLAALLAALAEPSARLVTIVGPGGIGKTRLALEAARRVEAAGGRAVRVARLGDLADAALVPREVCAALGVNPRATDDPLARAAEALHALGPALLVLDGAEPHVDAAAPQITALLERCPQAVLLAASRRRVGIAGERTLSLGPLETPPECALSPEALVRVPSVRLLLDRAQDVRPEAQATAQNAAQLSEIARRLEGIPLALVLAGRRLPSIGAARVLARLARRLDALEDQRRDAHPRHRTLRAAIDWSVDLLGDAQRRFFARLSAFRAPFTAEAAQHAAEEPLAPDLLQDLVDCSLLVPVERAGHERRFRFLDTVREDASERVPREERPALLARHRDWFVGEAERAAAAWAGPSQAASLDRLAACHDDLRAAMDRATADADADPRLALRMSAGLFHFWRVRGHTQEGRRLVARALARPGAAAPCRERAAALRAAGWLAYGSEDIPAARAAAEEAAAFDRTPAGDPQGLALTLNLLGGIATHQDDLPAAERAFSEGLALARARGDARAAPNIQLNLALVLWAYGRVGEARELIASAGEAQRALGSRRALGDALASLGRIDFEVGRVETGLAALAESRAIFEEFGDVRALGVGLVRLADALAIWGDGAGALERARAAALSGIEKLRRDGGPLVNSLAHSVLARIEARLGLLDDARGHVEEAQALVRRAGDDRFHDGLVRLSQAEIELARGRSSEARARLREALFAVGSVERSHLYAAQCMEAIALLDLRAGAAPQDLCAARMLGLAASFRAAREAALPARDRAAIDAASAKARARAGAAAWDAAFAEGRAVAGWEALVAGALALAKTSPA